MNLYLIKQDIDTRHDTYDSAVVAAKDEHDARIIHPDDGIELSGDGDWVRSNGDLEVSRCAGWVSPKLLHKLSVEFIGTTGLERGVVLASFNAA